MQPQEVAPKRPYIKKVVIHGFKTYGNHTDIEDFSSGMNVIGTLHSASLDLLLACFSNLLAFSV